MCRTLQNFATKNLLWNCMLIRFIITFNKILILATESVKQSQGKITLLSSLLTLHKILVWSQEQKQIDILKVYTQNKWWKHLTSSIEVSLNALSLWAITTAQKMKFSIEDFFTKWEQIPSLLRIWSHLLNKS